MSNDVVIRAEGLGKRYMIGHEANERESYTALRDVIARGARNLVRSTMDMLQGRAIVSGDTLEEFWALRDIDFEVRRGDVVGIVGRNGAGKSTLLKILSRITEPTEGRVTIEGRVASLLEVGTGFHPELTGRENIYLNGAILGMASAEIRRKFDEIVAFAEIEKFLDTPVKRYSSGMYVRLAFAVAAHLEPEILVVDEVLAVGDVQFQKKCLGKMRDVAGHGRTILFVSHNMVALQSLCRRAILLSDGRVLKQSSIDDVLQTYLADYSTGRFVPRKEGGAGDGRVALMEATVTGNRPIAYGSPFSLEMLVEVTEPVSDVIFGFGINSIHGARLITSNIDLCDGRRLEFKRKGIYRVTATLPQVPLWPGQYSLTVACRSSGKTEEFRHDGVAAITVQSPPEPRDYFSEQFPTALALAEWEVVEVHGQGLVRDVQSMRNGLGLE